MVFGAPTAMARRGRGHTTIRPFPFDPKALRHKKQKKETS